MTGLEAHLIHFLQDQLASAIHSRLDGLDRDAEQFCGFTPADVLARLLR
jgi:hypothetical protein